MTSTSIYDCITEQVIANFKPTRLYIKRHSITGVLYLGKTVTTGKKFESYYGGGIVWARHLKVHGKEHVETIWVSGFYTIDRIHDLVRDALGYSEDYNIINSTEWANIISENGLDGYPAGMKRTPEHCANIAKGKLGKKQTATHIANNVAANKGRVFTPKHIDALRACEFTPEHRAALSVAALGREFTPEHRAALSASGIGRKHTQEQNAAKSIRTAGLIWYNNGIINKRFKALADIPPGYHKGIKVKDYK